MEWFHFSHLTGNLVRDIALHWLGQRNNEGNVYEMRQRTMADERCLLRLRMVFASCDVNACDGWTTNVATLVINGRR